MRKTALIAAALILVPVSGAALAQAPQAAVAAGTAVKDAKGGDVGTVVRLDGQFYIVKTDKHEVRLPVSSFTPSNGVLLFGLTRDQLNAEVEKTLASAAEKIAPGAAVGDQAGGAVGTITAVDAESVTVKLASGTLVRLPKAAVAPGPNGAVVGSTAAQLEAAAKGSATGQ